MAFKILHTASNEEPLTGLLQESGFTVQYLPLFSYPENSPSFPQFKGGYCIVSSQRSVPYIRDNIVLFQDKDLYVVGEKTKTAVESLGLIVHFSSAEGIQGILKVIDEKEKNRTVIFLGTQNPTKVLQQWLTNNGDCIHLPVYQQMRIDHNQALSMQVDAIIVTSSNGAVYLSELINNRTIPIFVIGNTTHKSIRDCGFTTVHKSPNSTYESLVQSVTEYFDYQR